MNGPRPAASGPELVVLGPLQYGSEFADEVEREDAYWTHWDRVLFYMTSLPSRPWAWRASEYALDTPPEADRLATLARHGR